ncbi:hypothetical protein [Blastococcus haudaquaticus]|uniref:PH domain-containing protein n=1 Tax=Blastococcus haudaquaticus TaxID=1938745 RepID=A0A286GYR7_9ACTN|nr:hypothetical protein [Blastococcus haudaquaticus]SOE00622.1 hypothetical protein SAMN06272739_2695 [Blastococcus haudaquaticus]
MLRNQLDLARALWWALRGRTDVGPDDVPLAYNGLDRAVVWTITAVGVIETVIVHVLVSWPPLRWSLLALSVYGVLGLLAFDATTRQHPHLLRDGELVLRSGHFRSVRVPLEDVVQVRKHVRNEHGRTVEMTDDGVAVSFMGGTDVELRFATPTPVDVDGRISTVERVSFSAADPAAAVSRLRTATTGVDR